ncbi:IS1634 family transposase [archaeon SCG-AAA382B04]|nr:IS1634 family transposase [archaeon SCG-AAA382B04]
MWKEVGLDQVVKRALQKRDFQFDVQAALKGVIFNRLINPGSELSVMEWLERDIHFPQGDELELHHLYRSLDFLVEEKEKIEAGLFNRLLDLFSMDTDVVFYDTTLVSYRGEGGGNGLVQYSRNKEKEFLVGLMLSRDGFPFAHQVLPGNTADVSTVEAVADKLSERFSVGRCLFVADRGMISGSNLEYLEDQGRNYVVGVPARKYKGVRDVVLSTRGRYHSIKDNLRVKETELKGKRYIICHNPKEAKRVELKRSSIVEKLEDEIDGLNPETQKAHRLLSHPTKSKYLRQLKDGTLRIDRGQVREEARFDGKYVLVTNDYDLSSGELATTYRKLKRIEQSFHSLKSLEEVTPVYHRTPQRMKGHIFVCVLAHLLERALQKRLREEEVDLTVPQAIRELGRMKAVEMEVDGEPYLFRTEASKEANQVFKAMHMRPPTRVRELEE